jgi:hypothetical protein
MPSSSSSQTHSSTDSLACKVLFAGVYSNSVDISKNQCA